MNTTDQYIDSSTRCQNCDTALPDDAAFCPECGTAAGTHANESTMQTIGGLSTFDPSHSNGNSRQLPSLSEGLLFADRYMIEEQIGSGGMGVVYRATDTQTKQTVALKLVRPGQASGESGVERLKQEGLTTRNIRHKNVVAVYDVSESDGQAYITMEYLDGISLRQWHNGWKRAETNVPISKVRQIIEQLLAGLSSAHDLGVIHRDLKPENVFVTAEDENNVQIKILDFGIARAIGKGNSTSGAMGTARYMAPEQITSAELAGPSADLYSVSVIFYELLVDVLPTGHWQPPSTGRSDVSNHIDQLIEKGLSNRPANRCQSVDEYAAILNHRSTEVVKKENTSAPMQWLQQFQDFTDWRSSNPIKAIGVIAGWCFMGLIGLVLLLAVIFESEVEPDQLDAGTSTYNQTQTWDDYDESPHRGYQGPPQQGFHPNYY